MEGANTTYCTDIIHLLLYDHVERHHVSYRSNLHLCLSEATQLHWDQIKWISTLCSWEDEPTELCKQQAGPRGREVSILCTPLYLPHIRLCHTSNSLYSVYCLYMPVRYRTGRIKCRDRRSLCISSSGQQQQQLCLCATLTLLRSTALHDEYTVIEIELMKQTNKGTTGSSTAVYTTIIHTWRLEVWPRRGMPHLEHSQGAINPSYSQLNLRLWVVINIAKQNRRWPWHYRPTLEYDRLLPSIA